MAKLKKLAETAKIKLSTGTNVLLRCVWFDDMASRWTTGVLDCRIPVRSDIVEVSLRREQLEKLCRPYFLEMRAALDRCCWQAGVDLSDLLDDTQSKLGQPLEIHEKQQRKPVSEILLVGAATNMPAIGRFLENMTRLKVRTSDIHPEHCVAMGAAIEAARLSGELSEDFMMMDVWQAALMRAMANEQIPEQ